jgi:hypothetical protein
MKRPTVFCCRNFSSTHQSPPSPPSRLSSRSVWLACHRMHLISLPLSSLCADVACPFQLTGEWEEDPNKTTAKKLWASYYCIYSFFTGYTNNILMTVISFTQFFLLVNNLK